MTLFKYFSKAFLLLTAILLFQNIAVSQNYTIETFSNFNLVTSFVDTGDSIWFGPEAGVAVHIKATNNFHFLTNCNSGLGDNSITALERDSLGRIWVGTQFSGLFLFDGSNWTVFNAVNSPLNCDSIRKLKIDLLGNLWVAADVLYKFDGINWTVYPHVQGTLLNNINSLAVDNTNQLWLGTTYNGIFCFNGIGWKHFSAASTGIPFFAFIREVYCDHAGDVWAFSYTKLFKYASGAFDTIVPPPYVLMNPVDLASDTFGNLWIASSNDTLIRFDGNSWSVYGPNTYNYFKDGIFQIFVDKEQKVWMHNWTRGLARLGGNILVTYNLEKSIFSNQVNNILILNDSTAYIALRFGLNLKSGAIWTKDLTLNGELLFNVMDLGKEPDTLWVTASNNIFKLDATSLWTMCWPMIFVPPNYNTLFIDHANNKWFGTLQGEVFKYDNIQIALFNNLFSNNPSNPNTISDFNEDDNGNILIATGLQGLVSFDGINFTSSDTTNSGLPSNQVNCIAKDPVTGEIWLGTDQGIVKFVSPVPIIYNVLNSGLPQNDITVIRFDHFNNLWLGTRNHGLARYDWNAWTYFTMANSCLPGNNITCIEEDSLNKIWVGTDNGLAIFTEDIVINAGNNTNFSTHDLKLRIFPNPSNTQATLKLSPSKESIKLIISTLDGQEIITTQISAGSGTLDLSTSDLPDGIYFVQAITNQGVATAKLVVSH